MRFFSTRGEPLGLSLSEAVLRGLAPDGGLYVPDAWPSLALQDFDRCETLAEVGARLIAPFAVGDRLDSLVAEITADAFNFEAPLVPVSEAVGDGEMHVLELFHGPTAAFKDFGARFLAATFQRLRSPIDPTVNILVATSGDTGGAVAAAFHRRPGMAVTVLFPKGLVSPTQERQLTCWGDNVRSFAVAGTFDDCQRMVKEAFVDAQLGAAMSLSSANSINLGRLLPQAAYYASTSLQFWRKHARKLNFIIPSGNLGNAVACIWARHMGLPIGRIVLAHNANRTASIICRQVIGRLGAVWRPWHRLWTWGSRRIWNDCVPCTRISMACGVLSRPSPSTMDVSLRGSAVTDSVLVRFGVPTRPSRLRYGRRWMSVLDASCLGVSWRPHLPPSFRKSSSP